jgi:phytoene dehydrogenase-like protein
VGGGCRTEELTLPGYAHDVCSSIHPLLAASPFFAGRLPEGVRLRTPPVAFAHPLDGGRAASVEGSVLATARTLGRDERAYRLLLGPLVERAEEIVTSSLAPLVVVPRHPLAMARFGLRGVWPTTVLARGFQTEEARALLAGAAAHSQLPLSDPLTSAFGLLLTMVAHSVGWPLVEGGSARITDGMVAELEAAGGRVHTGHPISDLGELPPARATVLDTSARGLLELAGARLSPRHQRSLRAFRYGPGVFKVDWALSGPVPWEAAACRSTATVHVGGTLEEVVRSEAEVRAGRHPERPFVIVVQPTLFDPTRAPAGRHTLWGYCHVPSGSTVDMTAPLEAQIERFAPGFKDLVLERHTMSCADFETYNPNYVGGDINAGAATLRQTIFRPTVSLRSYRTPLPGVYLGSASTPPGGGVHGMCGVGAARVALRELGVRA